jgi:hypothetical protein
MGSSKDARFWAMKWYIWVVVILITGGVLASIGFHMTAGESGSSIGEPLKWLGLIICGAGGLVAIFAILLMAEEAISAMVANGQRLDSLLAMMNQQRQTLTQISHSVKLSDTAKEVLFRDMDRQSLREAVLEKLHQLDYAGTYALIEDIAHRSGYATLAQQLKTEADRYRGSTEEERMRQSLAHIEKLIDSSQWVQAKTQIDKYAATFDDKRRADEMQAKLSAKRDTRKGQLLEAWNDSVKKQDVDASLEILKELDAYLTSSEGLALQESAREVFRNKLQSMGVQFSLAVNEKRWADALSIGERIMADFPNTKMAQEIHDGMESLRQRASKKMTE